MRQSRHLSATCVLALVALASVTPPSASADERQPASRVTPSVVRGTLKATYFDISPPLREMMRAENAESEPANLPDLPDLVLPSLTAPGPQDVDPLVQLTTGTTAMPGTIANFDGHPNLCSCAPPSPSLDVGRNHVFLTTSLHYTIYDKSGTLLAGPFANNLIWAGFGAPCQTNNVGYPIVLYDQLADRWLISQLSSPNAPYGLCIAVSTTGDPMGSWYRWSFNTGTNFVDVPKWALWPDAYYTGGSMFLNASTYNGFGAFAFERADLLAGVASPSVISFTVGAGVDHYKVGHGLLPADLDGTLTPPPGSAGLFLGTMDNGGALGAPQDALTLWRFHADFVTPASSSFTLDATLPTTIFDSIFPCTGLRGCIPQPGTTTKLDFNSNRQQLLNRVSYRNFGTHQSIVANQSVEVAGIGGIRWYELRDPHGTPSLYQQGTYGPGISDGIHRWMAGVAMDNNGNMALGYSVSNAFNFPGIRYTGRLASDPLGTMPQGEATIVAGTGAQTSSSSRWGDYTTMAIDPVDDCTFWYANEYIPTTSSNLWRTRIASFRFPTCVATVGVGGGATSELQTALVIRGPSRGHAAITFTLGGNIERHLQLDIYDVSGRRLRSLVDATLPAGTHDIAWDGLDDSGQAVGAGVYFARLRAGRESDTGTILLLR